MNTETFLFLPLAAALAMYFMDGRSVRTFGILLCVAQLLSGLWLYLRGGIEEVRTFTPWLPEIGLNWSLALDGGNLWLVLLTPLLSGLALLTVSDKTERLESYAANVMLLNGLLCGLFLSQNLGLFYIFFEAMLLPAAWLVAGWSREKGRETALRFVMFTLVGSLPMLMGVLMLAFGRMGNRPDLEFSALTTVAPDLQRLVFPLFALAFLVKMPVLPFHGWLPALYRQAPASVVVVIAGLMGKAGSYGMLKVGLLVFPKAMLDYLPVLGGLMVVSLLYGAFIALGSDSLREILAYSSMSHMAMIGLGLVTHSSNGALGSTLLMAGHAVATGGLFLAVAMMEKRGMPDEMRRFGGLAQCTPRFAALTLFLTLAALGQPGLGSFPGELLILTGVFEGFPVIALSAALAIILAAAYMLRWYQVIFTGPVGTYQPPSDLRGREVAVLLVPIVLSLVMGFAPSLFLDPIQAWLQGVF